VYIYGYFRLRVRDMNAYTSCCFVEIYWDTSLYL